MMRGVEMMRVENVTNVINEDAFVFRDVRRRTPSKKLTNCRERPDRYWKQPFSSHHWSLRHPAHWWRVHNWRKHFQTTHSNFVMTWTGARYNLLESTSRRRESRWQHLWILAERRRCHSQSGFSRTLWLHPDSCRKLLRMKNPRRQAITSFNSAY